MRVWWIVLALAVGAISLDAHVGQRVFSIYQIPPAYLPDLTDGSVVDWEDAVPGPSIEFGELQPVGGVGDHPRTDRDNLTYQIHLGWSAETQRIYVAVERVDDIYVNDFDGGQV